LCGGLAHRYGPNIFPEPPFNGFWALFVESFQDPILLILIAAAVVSFAVGLAHDPSEGWIDGTAIVIAILLVTGGCTWEVEGDAWGGSNSSCVVYVRRVWRVWRVW
jgi:magnesium-transporting ATPase (P-type)